VRATRLALLPVVAVLTGVPVLAQQATDRWEKDIAAFEAADRATPPPQGEIVFVGSSSIVRWDTTASFPDLRIINRGFGGSELADAVRYADRIVIPYRPRLVVVYAGDNDIAAGRLSEQVVVEAERFVTKVRAALPDVRIAFIGLKPSPLRWLQVDRFRSVNEMLRAFCERDDKVAYVDVDGPMLGWDEKPRRDLFVSDGLHLSAEGYRLWTTLLRPLLVPTVGDPSPAPPTSGGRTDGLRPTSSR
jgi:lysophospholipase L1-like esterase